MLLFSVLFSAFTEMKIDIVSLRTNLDTCAIKCENKKGHLPYYFEGRAYSSLVRVPQLRSWSRAVWIIFVQVDGILRKIYRNNSLNGDDFPILRDRLRHSGSSYERNFKFYISAQYNFENKNWKSWNFKIQSSQWYDTNTTEYRYPPLGIGSFLYNWFI